MNENEIVKLADKISFKLLATKKHPNHQWLIDLLKQIK